MANARKAGIWAAVALFVVTLGSGAFVVGWYLWPEGTGQSASTGGQNPASTDNSAANQLQVGVYLSAFTATGPHRSDRPYGYETQLRPVKFLRDPSIHLIPVIEPRTRGSAEMTKVLWQNFPGIRPLDASNVDDLRKLDVLVATAAADVPFEVLGAVDESVRQGMGLVQRQFGYLTPGYTPQVGELCGFPVGTFGWNPQPIDCEVVGNHPLLGDLSGQIGKIVSIMPNGTVGKLSGIPLIRVKDMKQIRLVAAYHPISTGEYLYPLYISQLGRGKIVGIGFAQNAAMPEILESAHHGKFYLHCVEWVAGRPLQ
jgi:hypothetical protein